MAKLREHKTNDSLLLYMCEMGAGNHHVSGRFDQLNEVALEQAFLLKTQGMITSEPAAVANSQH